MGLVLNDADKLLCLFLAVAEIRLWDDASDEKRIRHNVSILGQKYKIFQLYKFYYRNSIIVNSAIISKNDSFFRIVSFFFLFLLSDWLRPVRTY